MRGRRLWSRKIVDKVRMVEAARAIGGARRLRVWQTLQFLEDDLDKIRWCPQMQGESILRLEWDFVLVMEAVGGVGSLDYATAELRPPAQSKEMPLASRRREKEEMEN